MKNKQVIKDLINALDECLADIEVRSYFEDEEDWKETIALELGMTSDEHFKHDYLCTFAVSEKEKTLNELAIRYIDECETYDRTVCTGGIKHGAIMPSNSRELGMIGENAKNVLKKLLELEVAFNHGITKRELMKEISRIDR